MKHGKTGMHTGCRTQPTCNRRKGRRVGPEPLVRSRQGQSPFDHHLLGQHCKPNPIDSKWKTLDHGRKQRCRCDSDTESKQRHGPSFTKEQLDLCFFAQGRGVRFFGQFSVHGGLEQLPSAAFCENFVADVDEAVGDDVHGQDADPNHRWRPNSQQQQRSVKAVKQEKAKRRGKQSFPQTITASIQNRSECPTRQYGWRQQDNGTAEHESPHRWHAFMLRRNLK